MKTSRLNFIFIFCLLFLFSASLTAQELENLGDNVNSDVSEINPLVTIDGRTLYFIRSTRSNGMDFQDIWRSDMDDNGNWMKAVKLEDPFNKGDVNNIISVTPDGNTIIFTRAFYNNQSMDTYITTRNGDSWSTPQIFKNNYEYKLQFKYVRYSHYCYY